MYKEGVNLETREGLRNIKMSHVTVDYASVREGEFTHNRSRCQRDGQHTISRLRPEP